MMEGECLIPHQWVGPPVLRLIKRREIMGMHDGAVNSSLDQETVDTKLVFTQNHVLDTDELASNRYRW